MFQRQTVSCVIIRRGYSNSLHPNILNPERISILFLNVCSTKRDTRHSTSGLRQPLRSAVGVSSCTVSEVRTKRLFCCFNSWLSQWVGNQRAGEPAGSFVSAGNFVSRGESAGFPQPLWSCRGGWMLMEQKELFSPFSSSSSSSYCCTLFLLYYISLKYFSSLWYHRTFLVL